MATPSGIVRFPGAGCVVEFMQGNRPQIAWVMEEQGGRLRLFLPNRRETKLAAARLLPWAGPRYDGERSRDDMVALLEEHRQRRDTREADIQPLELWEMVQGEVEQASVEWFAELLGETPGVDEVAAMGRALLGCKTHFKFHPPDFEVYDAAKVEARMVEMEAARVREALVEAGQAFIRVLWDVHCRRRTMPLPSSSEMPPAEVAERLATLLRTRMADPDDHDSDSVWKQVTKGLPDDAHMPLHLAAAWGIVPVHHNFWMDRAGYAPGDEWAIDHVDEIDALMKRVEALREPLVDGTFISIDSSTTRDIDDAFDISPSPEGGWILRLVLASPVTGWDFDGPLDRAVLRRATSIYLPERSHHMMPETLGTDAYSLLAGQDRPALLVTFDIAADGSLRSTTPATGWVRLAANLTYTECEACLTGEGDAGRAAPHADRLALADALARVRQQLRVAAGAVIIERDDPKVTLEGEGCAVKVHVAPPDETPRAQLLVSEMMILANAAIASWGAERGITLLHRTQDVGIPREYAGVWNQPHDIARVVKALAPAHLEPVAKPHAGIAVPAYSPVTSPLRRYPDLVNEAQVIHYLTHGTPRWSREEVEAMLPLLGARLDAAGQVQRFRPRYWKLFYIRQQGDKAWHEAVVTEENDAFVTISLPEVQIFVRGRRSTFGDKVYPGQHFNVRLGKVHPLNNEIQIVDAMEG